MAAPEPTAVADTPTTTDLPLRLVCTEAWGGNRFIDAPFEVPGVRGRLYSQPATGGSGGDVHCLAICNSGVLSHFCLADVVGHGDQVAAVGREIHGIIRQMLDAFDQRRILRKLNRQLYDGSFGRMTTAALASYEPPLGRLSISYAGHPPGWLYRAAEKRWTRLPLAKPPASDRRLADAPLAIDGATRFNRRTVRVSRGDRLLLVTDGVLEASDAAGTLFGDAGLQALLGRCAGHDARCAGDDRAGGAGRPQRRRRAGARRREPCWPPSS